MSLRLRHRSFSAGLNGLWLGTVLTGTCVGADPIRTEPIADTVGSQTTVVQDGMAPPIQLPGVLISGVPEPACPPPTSSPYSWRLVPTTDLIGMPICHRNFFADAYGENWRLQKWDLSTHSGRWYQRWHEHSLAMERCVNKLCGKLPRGYIYDTSGHPMRSFFVPQPGDPEIAYVPGSDTLMPSQVVPDYLHYVYRPKLAQCPECLTGISNTKDSITVITP